MAPHNPYAPSKASLLGGQSPGASAGVGDGVWRDADDLVVSYDASFPHRCVKCNEPSEIPHRVRKVYWHHPAVFVLLFGFAPLYVIVALIVRRTLKINPGLCARHLENRRLWIAIGWIGSLLVPVLLAVLANWLDMDGGLFALLALVSILVSAVAGILNSRILYPRRIDDRHGRLKGADERFLASLPNYLENRTPPRLTAFPRA